MEPSSLTLGPAHGDLLLRTTAEGRAARLGHDLTLRVRDWHCVIEVADEAPTRVAVTMDLGSLEVVRGEGGVKPLSAGDKRKILDGAAKTIGDGLATFTTTSITPTWSLTGELTLHGVTRPCLVEVTGTGDRWTARTSVRQTDFGITPYSQAMGTLRVGDVVEVQATVQL